MVVGKLAKLAVKRVSLISCHYCRNITFRDLCTAGRLPVPQTPELDRVLDSLLPCVIITPLDCYWEGSILQEPDYYIAPVNVSACVTNNPNRNDSQGITWGNVDFAIMYECLLAGSAESGFTVYLNAVCF